MDIDFESIGSQFSRVTSKKVKVAEEKQRKQQEARRNKELSGSYRFDEVALVLDPINLGPEASLAFEAAYPQPVSSESSPVNKSYHVYFESLYPGLCLWTHRRVSDGGHCTMGSPRSKLLPITAVLFPAVKFIELGTSCDVNSPLFCQDMSEEVRHIRQAIRRNLGLESGTLIRVNLVVQELEKALLAKQRTETSGISLQARLDDCIMHLIHELQVDVIRTKNLEESVEYLQNVSDLQADMLYKGRKHELDCVKRLPIRIPEHIQSEEDARLYELRKIWVHMLQMLPGVSETRASNFSQKYSCPKKLLKLSESAADSTADTPGDETALQFQYDFCDSKASTKKKSSQKKLSRLLYKMYTSRNETDRIDDDC